MIKIVTDSAAELTQEEMENLDIEAAPLMIEFPNETIASEDISRDAFYDRLKAMWPVIPTTSLPSPAVFSVLYRRAAAKTGEILSIHISSGLSNTINSARLAAQAMPESQITTIDTLTLSGGERFQVLAAALAARAGKGKEFILERLDQIRQATETVFTLETVSYLAKGGRIGRVQALAGLLLHIKPIIHVDHKDGKYTALGKERTMGRALGTISEHLKRSYGSTALWVTVMHGSAAEYAESLGEQLKSTLNVAKLETRRISPVLGVHTGPGVVGAAVAPAHLFTDLT
jgi:DegV family protein with EDD domain